MSESAFPN